MKAINLTELSGNDGWQVAARKINDNFKNLYNSIRSNTGTEMRGQSATIGQQIRDAEARIEREMTDLQEKLSQMIENLENSLDTAPPVGTWLHADYDPNEQGPGTIWARIDEGNFIIAAGSK